MEEFDVQAQETQICRRPVVQPAQAGMLLTKLDINAFRIDLRRVQGPGIAFLYKAEFTMTPRAGQQPRQPNADIKRRVFEELLQNPDFFRDEQGVEMLPLYDGVDQLFTPRRLNPTALLPVVLGTVTVHIRSTSDQEYIRFTDVLSVINSQRGIQDRDLALLTVLNIAIQSGPHMRFPHNRRAFFPDNGKPLTPGLQVRRGYFQSIRLGPGCLLLNMDVTSAVFLDAPQINGKMPLLPLVMNILGLRPGQENRLNSLREGDRRTLLRFLKGVKIRVQRPNAGIQGRARVYNINILGAGRQTFPLNGNDGQTRVITIENYYRERYNYRLLYPGAPTISTRTKGEFPLEILYIDGDLPAFRGKLTSEEQAKVVGSQKDGPQARFRAIQEAAVKLDDASLSLAKNPILAAFGLQNVADTRLIQITAQVLQQPGLQFRGRGANGRDVVPAKETPTHLKPVWDMMKKMFQNSVPWSSWVIVCFDEDQLLNKARGWAKVIGTTAASLGITFTGNIDSVVYPFALKPEGDLDAYITHQFKETILPGAKKRFGTDLQFVICLLPRINTPLKSAIKRVAAQARLHVSIALAEKNKRPQDFRDQYTRLYLHKINCKLGGSNLILAREAVPFLAAQNVMLFGLDLTHLGNAQTPRPSLAAVVGTTNKACTTYTGVVRAQPLFEAKCHSNSKPRRNERIAELQSMVLRLLQRRIAVFTPRGVEDRSRWPQVFLIYRDGISESEFRAVLDHEIEAFRGACEELDPDYKPTITYIVAGKNHHFRFKPTDSRQEDRTGNAYPGSLVQDGITHPVYWDFYLLHHPGLLGTSRPVHYTVLRDDNRFRTESLAQLTHSLVYTFPRATRPIALATPVYHADLVCTRVRDWIENIDHYSETATNTTNQSIAMEQDLENINIAIAQRQVIEPLTLKTVERDEHAFDRSMWWI